MPNKTALKESLIEKQNGVCLLSGDPLPDDPTLYDTDRKKERYNGGTYDDVDNVRAVTPVAHMKRHGIYREREESLNRIKTLIDGREQLRKLLNGSDNRIRAFERKTDHLDENTLHYLQGQSKEFRRRLAEQDKVITKALMEHSHPIVKVALGVKGLGSITVAYMLAYIDMDKAQHASSLEQYVGIARPSLERYEKGVAGGGCKPLRTVLYTMADSMVKSRGAYRDVYDREKLKKERSEKLVKSRNTQGKLVEIPWKDTKACHRHGHALRMIMKHFLNDWYLTYRAWEGLPTEQLYVEEKLGHKTIIRPEERGWVMPRETDLNWKMPPDGSDML